MKSHKVCILGASNKHERFSYKALEALELDNYQIFLVSPSYEKIEKRPVYKDLSQLSEIDTLTVYVSSKVSSNLSQAIIDLAPGRVIFNPGAENIDLERLLGGRGIKVERACTLVMLSTGQF